MENVELTGPYEIVLKAFSKGGASEAAVFSKAVVFPKIRDSWILILGLGLLTALLLTMVLLLIILRTRRARQFKTQINNLYLQASIVICESTVIQFLYTYNF